MALENCYRCQNLTINMKKNCICEWKHVNMGEIPYFPTRIPIDAKWDRFGNEVCRFEPKKE